LNQRLSIEVNREATLQAPDHTGFTKKKEEKKPMETIGCGRKVHGRLQREPSEADRASQVQNCLGIIR
jgi:hypothetical protein